MSGNRRRRMIDAPLLLFGGGAAPVIPWYLSGGVAAANCIAAYKSIGAASLAASYINLANPGTYDLTVHAAGTAPNFNTVTGWQFVAAGPDALNTGYVPGNTVNRSIIARISGATVDAATRGICGTRSGNAFYGIMNTTAESKAYFYNGNGTNNGLYVHSTNIADGVLAISGLDAYLDGVDIGNIGTAAANYNLGTAAVGIGLMTGVVSNLFNGYILAVAMYDIALTPAQVSAISTAMSF